MTQYIMLIHYVNTICCVFCLTFMMQDDTLLMSNALENYVNHITVGAGLQSGGCI